MVGAFVLAGLIGLAGCGSDRNVPGPVVITNRSPGTVDVTYGDTGRPPTVVDVATVRPGNSVDYDGPFDGTRQCLPGMLVAKSGDRTIATLDQGCRNTHWDITDSGGVPPS